jgi:uric acid-xanthine permease
MLSHCLFYSLQSWGGGAGCYYDHGLCYGNGNVFLPFGNAEYVGMGFFVFALIVAFEIFGSPFIRNGAVFLSLICGYIFAAAVPSLQTGASFISLKAIESAPAVTFLWTTVFPLGEYGLN